MDEIRDSIIEWDTYFLKLARTVASNSKCFSRKIGAILVRDNSIVSTGYNGPPRKFFHCDDPEFLEFCGLDPAAAGECPRRVLGFKSGEGLHICPAGHAERNVLINAARLGIGICTKGTTMYMTCGLPCKDCAIEIINAGVAEIVIAKWGVYYDRLSPFLFQNSEVKVRAFFG